MPKTEIKIGGFGGQGVILSGYILGRAASIFDTKYATMIQAFGPEARGSSCSAQLIVSDEAISYPYITAPNLMIIMSQEAYTKYSPELAEGGTLITEEELVVTHNLRRDISHYSIPGNSLCRRTWKANCCQYYYDRFYNRSFRSCKRGCSPGGGQSVGSKRNGKFQFKSFPKRLRLRIESPVLRA